MKYVWKINENLVRRCVVIIRVRIKKGALQVAKADVV